MDIADIYFRDRMLVGTGEAYPTRDPARRVAINIARLPQLLAVRAAAKAAMDS